MRRTRLFLSRAMLGLWAALICASFLLLWWNSPTAPDAPFSSMAIAVQPNSVYLPTQSFDCTETDPQFQCETTIQRRPLVLTWKKGGASQDFPPYPRGCEAVYDGQAVGCNSQGMSSVIGQPDQYELTDLGLSAQQLRAVRQKYWGVNALQKLGEPRLMSTGLGLAIFGGVSIACFVWLQPGLLSNQPGLLSNLFVSLAYGFGTYFLASYFLSSVMPYDPSGTYETFQTWYRLIKGGAMTAGAIAMLLVALMLRRRNYRFGQALVSLVSGAGTAALCSYLTLFTLLWLGYAD